MKAYYNEIDPKKAAWLRELIERGLVADGEVDTRSIDDIAPDELSGYTQCHFFAGIGIWSYALRLAGWPDDKPVWTGSCPCQSFSAAGKGNGFADERHLWPAWFHLISQCRPDRIFGEQVGAAISFGWLDLVHDDLAAEGYTTGSVVLPACSAGAPHIRQRLWFVGDSGGPGLEGHVRDVDRSNEPGRLDADAAGSIAEASGSFWSDCEWLPCTDGKARPVKSGLKPLVDGAPERVVRLRGYGDGIVPQVAAAFIEATMMNRSYGHNRGR